MGNHSGGSEKKPDALLRGAAACICAGAVLLGLYAAFRYLLPALWPFLAAWVLARMIRRPVGFLHDRLHLPRQAAALLMLLLPLFLGGWLLTLAARRALREWQDFVASGGADALIAATESAFERLAAALSDRLSARWENGAADLLTYGEIWLNEAMKRAVGAVTAHLSGAAMRAAGALPRLFLSVVVTFLAAVFLAGRPGGTGNHPIAALIDRLSPARRARLCRLWTNCRTAVRDGGRKLTRAFLWLGLLTFFEMFLGLSILRVPCAFGCALFIAFVDALPLFGTGIVLLPLGILSLLQGGDMVHRGFGLIALYGIHLILRQIAEPHLIGRGLGLSPFASLLSMYIGFRLGGCIGLMAAPAALLVVRTILRGELSDPCPAAPSPLQNPCGGWKN